MLKEKMARELLGEDLALKLEEELKDVQEIKSDVVEKTNRYEVKVYYYIFNEDEVIRKILSLGPYVTVKSPEGVRSKIIDILRHAMK